MAKSKKKRTKKYQGVDAAVKQPSITKVSAADRSKPAQWWVEHKRIAKPVLTGVAIALGVMWLLYELIRIATH